ncbi:hypothetical protein HID58_000144 [Brassica napus]|uniref:Myb-like domain-containing protein n=1 Tax=Brassica napus TaxID=3708 RepID=A0ABQ8EGR2_BRANA|nr:hypothetical protein HID58_000144 [Brassica napus]
MSCRLLRPDVKRGNFSVEEEETIVKLHQSIGSKYVLSCWWLVLPQRLDSVLTIAFLHFGFRWSKIASKLPERTDNEIKKCKRLSSNTNLDANAEAATKGSLNRELNQISTGRFIYKLYNSSFVLETQLKDTNHDDKKHLDSFNREYMFSK